MKRALAIVAGALAGVLLAGILAPMMIVVLPPRLRGESIVLIVAATVVAAATCASWVATSSRR
jgi:hypothetical protein